MVQQQQMITKTSDQKIGKCTQRAKNEDMLKRLQKILRTQQKLQIEQKLLHVRHPLPFHFRVRGS